MTDAPYAWDVPSGFNFARDIVDRLAAEDRLGLMFVDAGGKRREYTFAQIAEASKKWASVLRDAGIGKGDRVVVVLPKIPDWLFCMTAMLRIGAVAVPSAEQLRAKDLLYRANHSGAVAVVAYAGNAAEFDAMRADATSVRTYLLVGAARAGWTSADPLLANAQPWDGAPTAAGDMAYVVYTSGTTKDPKGVVHSVAYTYAKRMQAAIWFDVKPHDLVWCTAGTGWAKSLWNVLLGPWSCGAPIVLHEGAFVPEERMDMIRDLGVTVLCQAPTEYRLLAKLPQLGERWKLPHLRHCVSAGEPLNPEVIELWKAAFGLTILDGYGQTENTLLVANRPGTDVRPGSMGKPTPGHDVAVVDEHGNVMPSRGVGVIELRGESLTPGYLTMGGFIPAQDEHGWYDTGDLGYQMDNGHIVVCGRVKDVIIMAGRNIYPTDIERAAGRVEGVRPGCAVAVRLDAGHSRETFAVAVESNAWQDPVEVRRIEHQVAHEVVAEVDVRPRNVVVLGPGTIPKTPSGKLRRSNSVSLVT